MFYSILYPAPELETELNKSPAASFEDIQLDMLLEWILENRMRFDLRPYFYTPIQNEEVIKYRQGVLRDLESSELNECFSEFSQVLRKINLDLERPRDAEDSSKRFGVDYRSRLLILDGVDRYCRTVSALSKALERIKLTSVGIKQLSEYISQYTATATFKEISERSTQLRERLAALQYCIYVTHRRISVVKYEGQKLYSEALLDCFKKFEPEDTAPFQRFMPEPTARVDVDNMLFNMLADVEKEVFAELMDFCAKYSDCFDQTLYKLANDVQFYLAWLDFIKLPMENGLKFCYPEMTQSKDHVFAKDCYSITLAHVSPESIVTNDFELNENERVMVITGPNQGGKTTFLRMFAQTHFLGALGLSVPGSSARLFMYDRIYSHFGHEEIIDSQNGRLRDELIRLRDIKAEATDRSIIVTNEIFASTTFADALWLSDKLMSLITELGVYSVFVTFMEELASFNESTVSMVGVINEDDPTRRTYKIVRKPADGLAYAEHIAGKYGLTYDRVRGRIVQ